MHIEMINKELNKAAINFAAESECWKNLRSLLNQFNGKVNVDHEYEGETALLTLSKRLNPTNIRIIMLCMDLLLRHGAEPNSIDRENKTALQHLLSFAAQNAHSDQNAEIISMIGMFLMQPKLSLDNYLQGINALRKMEMVMENWKYVLFVRQVVNLPWNEKIEMLREYDKTIKNWNHYQMHRELLKKHTDKSSEHREEALEALHETLDLSTAENVGKLVELAIICNNWTAASQLLKCSSLTAESKKEALMMLIKQSEVNVLIDVMYQEVLHKLLEDLLDYVNQYGDHTNTMLHYAVFYQNEVAIRELLRQGAKLGMRNDMNVLCIEDIDANLLKEHFDECIMNRQQRSHKEYEIIVNYMNLTNQQDKLDIAPIVYMAKSNELRSLLQHPVITCFLALKWQRFSTMFYIHFLVFVLFGFSLITHVILRFPERMELELAIIFLNAVLALMVSYVVIIDIFAYFMANRLPSFIDAMLLVAVALTCCEWEYGLGTQKMIAVVAVLLMAIKLILLIGALPVLSISTHMLMLRQVTTNFVKCLTHYSLIVLTFAFCFYILLGRTIHDTDKFLSYLDLRRSFLKTLVMFSGEFDDGDFSENYSSMLLIMFMFITMILTNLLAGLAVNDTQMIKAQVELNAAICRTNLLNSFEGVLNTKFERHDWLRVGFQKFMNLKEDSTFGSLSIFPNKDNQAEVYNTRHRNKSIKSLAKSDQISMTSLYHENEDGGSSSNSTGHGIEYEAYRWNDQGTAFEFKSKECINNSHNDKGNIEERIVKRALYIIQKNTSSKLQREHEEIMKQRQKAVWLWVSEQESKELQQK